MAELAIATPEDITFWQNRFSDHYYILAVLLDRDLAPELKEFATVKYNEFSKTPDSHTRGQLEELLQFKLKLVQNQEAKRMIGMIFPSLLEHMIMELTYFLNLVDGKLTVQDELDFYLEEASEHALLAGHLTDPKHKELVMINHEMGDLLESQIGNPPSMELFMIVDEANASSIDLLNGIESGNVKALLTPFMLKHEIVEGQYGQKKLAQQLAKKNLL